MPKKLFISAGNRGIGLEFVKQCFDAGWTVYATARRPEEADELKEIQQQDPERLQILKLDVTLPEAVEAVGRTMERLTSGLDLLINNAGRYGSAAGFQDLTVRDFKEVLDINCLGAFRLTRRLFPLIKKNSGKLIFITSLMGSIDDNHSGGVYPYRISKAALNMFGKTISEDYKDEGIYSLLLHPGWVQTRMGGPNAKITPTQAVEGMRRVIEQLDKKMSGGFFAYDGRELPW